MRAALALAAASVVSTLAQQPPPRDRPASPRADPVGGITGVVLSDEAKPRPLRRAAVVLSGSTASASETTITGDDGTFAFRGLGAGRYSVRALKEAYVPMAYGAVRPARPGTGIHLTAGETAVITIALPRGAVIAGTVTDEEGQPASGLIVQAFRAAFNPMTGEQRLQPERLGASLSAITDDRGAYRIYGLPAGEYAIGTIPRVPAMNTLRQSPADVRRALAEVRGSAGSSFEVTADGASRAVTMSTMYYPGVAAAAQAAKVTLRAGEERGGIDIRVRLAPSATITGTVTNLPAGFHVNVMLESMSENRLVIRRGSHVDGEGRFVFWNVEPGTYLLVATVLVEGRTDEPGSRQYAMAEVAVDEQDIGGVVLAAQPTLTLAGRLEFEGTPPAANAVPRTVRTPTLFFAGSIPLEASALTIAGARFRIDGLVPGVYAPANSLPGLRIPVGRWWLKSVVAGGRDLLDAPLEIRQSIDDAVATFTERPSELTGRVMDRQGHPVAQSWVVAFPTEPQFRFMRSRRVAAVQTDASGRYSIRNLPPGDYLLAAAYDFEQNEWFDPAVLDRLTPAATRIAIGEAETKKEDLAVR